jgi:hypothetical protein
VFNIKIIFLRCMKKTNKRTTNKLTTPPPLYTHTHISDDPTHTYKSENVGGLGRGVRIIWKFRGGGEGKG